MSLIISMNVPDCIVVASDSCMTMTTTHTDEEGIQNVTAMSYREHSPKMVVFRDRLVVTFCSNMDYDDMTSVYTFLTNLKSEITKAETPKSLAEKIQNKYADKRNDYYTIFIVSGYVGNKPYVYCVDTREETADLQWSDKNYGASYRGETHFVHDMLCSVRNYSLVSIKDAVTLVETMMDCISVLSKFWKSRSVGGDIDIYIMFRDKTVKSGWVRAGQYIPVLSDKEVAIKGLS